jgi:small subunit ribosomal protein S20
MPVIKSARKKLRKDKKIEDRNSKARILLSKAVKIAVKNPAANNVKLAVKLADKAAKNKLIHKNKAGRIKSRLSKLIKPLGTKAKPKLTPKNKSPKAKK